MEKDKLEMIRLMTEEEQEKMSEGLKNGEITEDMRDQIF